MVEAIDCLMKLILYMYIWKTSISWRLNILCIMLKIMTFFVIKLFARLYVRVDILLSRVQHLHDRIISIRGEVFTHKTTLTPPKNVPSQESIHQRFCYCFLELFQLWYFPLFYQFHHISLAALYWYIADWETWWYSITGHMRVILSIIFLKIAIGRLWKCY